ncbi:MAG: methionine--tRNA ligase [Candidatus Andersenbacteria bacterium CG10_big_fil_rev_8_21_14_0_10_54_11]|uniref:Methionine--tRNA ligase n=1 Tax=Candidatus Andersenbacteria bacterium CG10_big_fil_rev_8_21_14_0_10_54_11 TaxID=1974485 RepID=A0A2M6WZM5_9BACT|nr:MAG: methionine--tRNA ligase [Candidatus Andersenbacteria bacterium CG10_big_fil_rev_8_21_14_0_10_54_11]
MKKFYLTTPIYYVNAAPHVGSAYTTIAADVLARHYRQQGRDVFLLTGTAEHGQKMAQAARAAGMSPQEFVGENSARFAAAWQKLNIRYDDFIRTSQPRHEAAVKKFFERLKSSGEIYEGEYEGLYCVGHEAFLKESELDDEGKCPDHQTVPETVKEKNWFFKLSAYAEPLTKIITKGGLVIQPESKKKEVLSFIGQGLDDISISRQNVEFAIPLPWDASQTIYVWLDELFNYCSAIGYGLPSSAADRGERAEGQTIGFDYWWPADLHLIGKDIIKFHCIIWPALLLAAGLPLPKKVFAHGFFTINGQKISKSLGNAIDPVVLADEYGADAVRYFILRDIPFGNDGDFSTERLRERYNADLANGLGNLVSRVLNMMEQYKISPPDTESLRQLPPVKRGIGASKSRLPFYTGEREWDQTVAANLESLAFDKALEVIWHEIQKADELIEQKKPWELAKAGSSPNKGRLEGVQELEKVLNQLYRSLVTINAAIASFMPETHEKLTGLLAARPLKKPAEPLFARKKSA